MTVPKAKKPKRKKTALEKADPNIVVNQTIDLVMSIVIRTLVDVYDFKDLDGFCESCTALMSEIQDGRVGVYGAMRDCKARTGIDVGELFR